MLLEGVLYELVSREEGSAVVRLLPESPIYKAHFPGYPITPGVTLVQMALDVMGVQMKGAKDIKFVVPVPPTAGELHYTWTYKDPSTAEVLLYLPGETLCAKMTLSV